MLDAPARCLSILGVLALACSSSTASDGDPAGGSATGESGESSDGGVATSAPPTSADTTSDDGGAQDTGSDDASPEDDTTSDDAGSTDVTTDDSPPPEPAVCGDGIESELEQCDDGNTESNDGCSATCEIQRAVQVSAGGWHSCAILDTGALRCWGNAPAHGHPEIGDYVGDDETPAAAGDVAVGGTPTQIVGGWMHGCARLDTGTVRCWGSSSNGELGYGNVDTILSPESGGDVETGGAVTQLAAGHQHTCALLDDATVRCWGIGLHGQLGQAATDNIGDDEIPASVEVIDVGGDVVQITAGIAHTCALLDTGNVRCWGLGNDGALGYGDVETIGDDEAPASAGDVDVGGTVIQISASHTATCALLDGGTVRCWGRMEGGALGYPGLGTVGDDETPAEAGDIDVGGAVEHVSVGAFQICALLEGGSVRCWGYGPWGNLGHGSPNVIGDDETPATAGDIDLGGPVDVLDAQGFGHSCAVLDSGAVRCWGFGGWGQLGYPSLFPTNVGDNETPASVGNVEVF